MACPECGGVCDGPHCGTHAAGCFYGGPRDEGFWFAVSGCQHPHEGAGETLWATPEGAAAAWEHLTLAGLRVTSESG